MTFLGDAAATSSWAQPSQGHLSIPINSNHLVTVKPAKAGTVHVRVNGVQTHLSIPFNSWESPHALRDSLASRGLGSAHRIVSKAFE